MSESHRAIEGSHWRNMVFISAMILCLEASPGVAQMPGFDAIERIQNAIRLHPEDPDLAWALARKLAATGRAAEALRETRRFITRWPGRQPQARLEIARSLIDAGYSARARVLLDEELKENPKSAVGRFYRGIAFRAEGLIAESNREFVIAGELAPQLRAESLLAQALGLFDLGKEEQAVDLLRQILQLDPTTESAIRARLMLRQREMMNLKRSWRLDAHAGFEWDSNVLLETSSNESSQSNRADFRGIWGLGATIQTLRTEKRSLTLGYRFDQSVHDDLGRFDLLTNSGFASGSLQLNERLVLRIDALAWNTRQGGENALTAGTIRPNLILSLGSNSGALRAFAQYQVFEYPTNAALDPFERDGYSFGGGVEHFIRLPLENSILSTSVSYQRNLTQSKTSGLPDGFDGDFDYDSIRVRSRAILMLPGDIRAIAEASYSNDRYHNDNFLEALTALKLRKRRDDIAAGRIEFRRTIAPHTALEIYWRGTWRMSNVAAFKYDQQVVGALIRVSTD